MRGKIQAGETKKAKPVEMSSVHEKEAKKDSVVMDPRFIQPKFNPLRHFRNYGFLYELEKDQMANREMSKEERKSRSSRIEARERYIKIKEKEKERRDEEMKLVEKGKKPFYQTRKQKKIEELIDKAQEKGAEYVINKIKKKTRERENKSRMLVDRREKEW